MWAWCSLWGWPPHLPAWCWSPWPPPPSWPHAPFSYHSPVHQTSRVGTMEGCLHLPIQVLVDVDILPFTYWGYLYSTVYEDAENGCGLQVASTPVFCKYNWPSYASFYILFYVPCHQLLAASQRDPIGESGMSGSRLCGCQQEHPDLYTTQPGTVHTSNFLHCTSWDTEIDFI